MPPERPRPRRAPFATAAERARDLPGQPRALQAASQYSPAQRRVWVALIEAEGALRAAVRHAHRLPQSCDQATLTDATAQSLAAGLDDAVASVRAALAAIEEALDRSDA